MFTQLYLKKGLGARIMRHWKLSMKKSTLFSHNPLQPNLVTTAVDTLLLMQLPSSSA